MSTHGLLAPTPTSPLLALRAAILAYLALDATLARLMGGSFRLTEEPPRGAAPVYALFGDAEIRDESVDGARRHRHVLALTVFAKPGSTRGAVDVAERIADLLHDAPLSLAGHALVRLDLAAIAVRRDPGSGETRATLSLGAITERL